MVDKPGTLVKKGQRIDLSGVIRFVKKESGWTVANIGLARSSVGADSTNSPRDTGEKNKSCINNLKQIALAARIWSIDHNDVLPPNFLTMSNELISLIILICLDDKSKTAAVDWSHFSSTKNFRFLATFRGWWWQEGAQG